MISGWLSFWLSFTFKMWATVFICIVRQNLLLRESVKLYSFFLERDIYKSGTDFHVFSSILGDICAWKWASVNNIVVLLWSVSCCFLNMSFILLPVLKSKPLPAVCADLVKPCMASNIPGCFQSFWWGSVQRWIFYWFCDEKKPGLLFISHFSCMKSCMMTTVLL